MTRLCRQEAVKTSSGHVLPSITFSWDSDYSTLERDENESITCTVDGIAGEGVRVKGGTFGL